MNKIEFSTTHYGELSNFHFCVPLCYNGHEYPTSEHLYQAMKFAYFDNGSNPAYAEFVAEIRNQRTPYQAKTLATCKKGGRYEWQRKLREKAKTFTDRGVKLDEKWDSVRVSVMEDVLRLKFWSDRRCQAVLLGTGKTELVERTDTDAFWGDGADRKGENTLGKLLMKIRDEWAMNGVPKDMPPFYKFSNK